MPVVKSPEADLRRRYPRYQQIGLALSLGLVILAFTVPVDSAAPEAVAAEFDEPIVLEDIPLVAPPAPPPPPPPAPPPPVEVPDNEQVEEDILSEFEIDVDDVPLAPPGPPDAPQIDLPSPADPPAPPAPTIEDDLDKVFIVAEVQPVLIDGIAGLQGRVEYPEFARRAGIEGQVVVQFVVDERGNVVDPVVLRSPNDLLSEAAIKAVQESRFTPGQQRGRPVKVRFAVPVTFRLR